MLRLCNEQSDGDTKGCGRVYDDVHRSTICPHDSLGVGAYCKTHDLIACSICQQQREEAAASEEPACP